MKNLMTLTLAATLAFGAIGCSKKADMPVAEMSAEQLTDMVIGSWVMEDMTVNEGGVEVKLYDSVANYNVNGTSTGESKMEFVTEDMPADMRGFKIAGKTRWSIVDGSINDTVTEMNVTPLTPSSGSVKMAAAMQSQMGQVSSTTSEIVSVSKNTLVISQDGTQMTYTRK